MQSRALFGLPVYTQRGAVVGKVSDIEIDVARHVIALYHVSAKLGVAKIIGNTSELLIRPSQVVSIDEDKMIVDDAVAEEAAPALLKKELLQTPA